MHLQCGTCTCYTGSTSTQEAQRELGLRFDVDAAGQIAHWPDCLFYTTCSHTLWTVLRGIHYNNTRRSHTPCHCCTNYVVMLRLWI
jgi:hypothetical protein